MNYYNSAVESSIMPRTDRLYMQGLWGLTKVGAALATLLISFLCCFC